MGMKETSSDKSNTYDLFSHLFLPVLIANFLLNFTFQRTSYISVVLLTALSLTFALVLPVRDWLKKGSIKGSLAIFQLTVSTVLVLLFITSIYIISFSNSYSLKYSFWIALISLNLILYIYFLAHLINNYKGNAYIAKRISRFDIGLTIFFALLIPCAEGYDLIKPYMLPQRQVEIYNLKTPEKITIYRHGDNSQGGSSQIGEISSVDDIKKIIEELKPIKTKNLVSTELMNYKRNIRNNSSFYFIVFNYGSKNGAYTKIEEGYIFDIVITSNRNAAIEELVRKKELFNNSESYFEIYPVKLSDGTMDMIFSYVK